MLTWVLLTVAGFTVALGGVGDGLFGRLSSSGPSVPGEAADGYAILAAAPTAGPSYQLMLQGVSPPNPGVAGPLAAGADRIRAIAGVASVVEPRTATDPTAAAALTARDGNGFLVSVTLRPGLPDDHRRAAGTEVLQQLRLVGAQLGAAVPGARSSVGGGSLIFTAITDRVEKDLVTGEVIALPVSLLVLILVFGGFLAAGMPIAGAVVSIAGGLASLLVFSYVIDLDASVVNVVTVLGLGLCIDYSLLLVSRYREELRSALDRYGTRSTRAARSDALATTMATAGRTVLFSGLMVAISVGGLLVFQASILRAVGAAAISVVLVAVCVALTFIPAVAALAGTRLLRPGFLARFPPTRALVTRLGDVPPADGRFSALARWTQRRPWLVVVGTLVLLGVLAAPVLGLQVRNSGVALLPPDAPARVFVDTLDRDYPALASPAVEVVAETAPGQLGGLAERLRGDPAVASVPPPRQLDDRHALLSIVLKDPDSGGAAARAVVADLREHRPDFPTWVTGPTAALLDFTAALGRQAPVAVAVVVIATFLLLFLLTGSLLVPAKALVMNVVSLGASLGVLVWVFQDGHGEKLLNFASPGGIEIIIPLLVLALGFGLSTDYEVFLISRIKELRDRGASNHDAVAGGLQRSGRIITSAALIIVLVFAGFVAGQLLVIKETGVALAVAVALDASIVRCLLVPATMTLLGEWNWWAPPLLRRWHARIGLRE